MTAPDGTAGIEPITAPGIHDGDIDGASAPRTQKQMRSTGEAMVEIILAQVFYAFAGVSLFGVHPFEFMRGWADDLVQRANDAYNNAANAQGSADTANTGLAILTARFNALGGGVSYWDTFDRDTPPGTPTNDALDATGHDYTMMYGSGSGVMETSVENDGTTVWHAVGFADRSVWIRRETALVTTNNQRISMVFNNFSYGAAGNQPHIYLMCRWNNGATRATSSFVQAIIGDNSCEIGYVINGTYARFGGAVSVEHANGDLWDLEVGNASDPWQFKLLQNNALRVDRNDIGHLSMKDTVPGTLYQYSGFGADAGVDAGAFFTTFQIGPPKIQVLAGVNTA